jgi:dTDP-4-amino-4,6-dideoxygalactose transaminase
MDSMPGSYNVGPRQFAERIGPGVKAAVIVHSIGQAAPIDEIVEIARARGIKIVEDCSQSHGALYKGQKVGTFGDIAAFSTMYRKAHMSGASGGAIYSRNEELFHLALAHADRGKPRWRTDFDDRDPSGYLFPALNWHSDEISCAIAIASLGRMPASIAARLDYVLGVVEGLKISKACRVYPVDRSASPFIYPIIVDRTLLTCSKTRFAEAIAAEGIGLNTHYKYLVGEWLWLQPYLVDAFETPNARDIRDSTFCLYLNEKYGAREVQDTLAAIAKVETALAKS